LDRVLLTPPPPRFFAFSSRDIMLRCVALTSVSLLAGGLRVVKNTDNAASEGEVAAQAVQQSNATAEAEDQEARFVPHVWPTWPYEGDTFWGIPLSQSPCIFVLDKSNSMQKTAKGGDSPSGGTQTRDEASYQELKRSLNLLTCSAVFNVITFSSKANSSFPDVVLATPGHVSAALATAAPGGLSGQTNTHEALRLAYSSPTAPKNIYLLSDGLPYFRKQKRSVLMADILRDVKIWDSGRGIKLNVILLNGDSKEKDVTAKAFMQRLATENGGAFREVPF